MNGDEHEEPPQTVDDAGDGGEQFDQKRERARDHARREVGQKRRRQDADERRQTMAMSELTTVP